MVQFNIDYAYVQSVVKNKLNNYYIDSEKITEKNGSIHELACNFIEKHKKNESIRLFDKNSGKLRFEGIVFVSKKQGCCSTYSPQGNIIKREHFTNDSKVSLGMHLNENGKLKTRCDYSRSLQEENGFCVTYHPNGSINKIGKKVLSNFTDMFAEFYYDGTMVFIREKSIRSCSDIFDL